MGESVWLQFDELCYAAAVIGTVLCFSVRPRYWGRSMRELFARQVLVAFASGYLFGAWRGTGSRHLSFFTNTVLNALRPQDIAGIVIKSILPALFTSASCCLGSVLGDACFELTRGHGQPVDA